MQFSIFVPFQFDKEFIHGSYPFGPRRLKKTSFFQHCCDGRFIERVGFYNPVANEKQERVRIAEDRLNHWVGQGAQLSEAVIKLVNEKAAAAA